MITPNDDDALLAGADARAFIDATREHLMDVRPPMSFREELQHLINRYGVENASDTPDYLLANYLMACLDAFNGTVRSREQWYGRPCGNGAAIVGPAEPDGTRRLGDPSANVPRGDGEPK
jgi:hypothetical protein